jgi:hypothetical protein
MGSALQLKTASWIVPTRVLAGSKQPWVAACLAEALLLGERTWKKYDLCAWVIMANHVHVLDIRRSETPHSALDVL